MVYTGGMDTAQQNEKLTALIKHVGGVTSMAHIAGVTEGAVRHWQRKGGVPRTVALLLSHLYPAYETDDLQVKDAAE